MSLNLRQRFGLLRSIAMYYWKPFNKRKLKRFYGQFISEGDLCFDIGAHIGNRTNAWLALGARVVAVEPQPACIEFLNRKFGRDESAVIVPKAVSDKPGNITLHISQTTPTISTASDDEWRDTINENAWYDVTWENSIDVEAVTLDDLIREHGIPSFCKIDVENYESRVLAGLSQPLPLLSFEYFPPDKRDVMECFDILESLGTYEFNWSFGESQKLNSDRWLSAGEMRAIINDYTQHKEYGDIYARHIS